MIKKLLLLIGLIIFLITGCGVTKKPVILQFYNYKADFQKPLLKAAELFQQNKKSITVNIQFEQNDGLNKLYFKLKKGDPVDIFLLPSYGSIKKLAGDQNLADLSAAAFHEKIYESTKEAVTFEDKIYALPLNMTAYDIIYHRDLFHKHNIAVPMTNEKLKSACDILQKKKITPFASSIKDNWPLGYLFAMAHSSMIAGNHRIWLEAMNSGVGSFNSMGVDRMFQVFDLYLTESGKNALQSTFNDQLTSFAQKKSAMMIGSVLTYETVKSLNPHLDCGIMPLPLTDNPDETGLFMDVEYTLALNKNSSEDNQSAAITFLNFLITAECQKLFLTDPRYVSPVKGITHNKKDQLYQDMAEYLQNNKNNTI